MDISDKAARKLLQELVEELDHDIAKSLFLIPEEPEFAEEQIEGLVGIIKRHVRRIK